MKKRVQKNDKSKLPSEVPALKDRLTKNLLSLSGEKDADKDNERKFAHLLGKGSFLVVSVAVAIGGILYIWKKPVPLLPKDQATKELEALPDENDVDNLPLEVLVVEDQATDNLEISPDEKDANKDTKRKIVPLLGKTAFLVVFVALAIGGMFYTWSWSITNSKAQSEAYTELYFDDNLHLPSEVIPKQPYFFQFTLHNLESKDMKYSYEVYINIGQDKLIFDKGAISVKENDYKTIQEKFAIASLLPRSEIVVDLINKNQQIDFWIDGNK